MNKLLQPEYAYAVEMNKITKTFLGGSIVANKDIDLKVKKGHIHALVGENGAGKSTLMSILFGMYQPTSGSIKINGEDVIISDPVKANRLGIGMVHQHFKLVQNAKVWQNIALGAEGAGTTFLNASKIKRRITDIMDKYGLHVDLDAKIQDISVGMQQRVEILKILYREVDILVFDEPTAVLTPKEIDELLDIMLGLKAKGKTIIFISHKMDEIKKVADEATVIRLGKKVKDFDMKNVKGNELAEAMVGRKLIEVKNKNHNYDKDKVLLNVINLTVKKDSDKRLNAVEGLNLQVHPGEILAVAGVEGNGQTELVEAITGLAKVTSGGITYHDVNINSASIKDHYKMGMSHIPEDRHKYAMVMDFNVLDNIALQNIGDKPFSRNGFINENEVKKYGLKIIHDYDVRGTRDGMAVSRGLSGGNQQKFVVGREMTRDHDLLIVVQPTRGLDIGAIEHIHQMILDEKKKGKGVLLISYELSEVMELADNIAVINNGKIAKVLPGATAKREEIGALMGGAKGGNNEQ